MTEPSLRGSTTEPSLGGSTTEPSLGGSTRRRIAVVGGGISGLAAAWAIRQARPDVDVVLFEAAAQVGGKLRIGEIAGHHVDVGAEALLVRRPEGRALVDAVGLGSQLVAPLTLSARVRARGANHPLPRGTIFGVPGNLDELRNSGLLSDAGFAAVVAEADRAPLEPIDGDIAVGELATDRLGTELVQRLIEPLLGGVYAGDPNRLSLAATMPQLFAVLAETGGYLCAAAQRLTPIGAPAAPADVFASLAGGLGQLPSAIAASLPDVRTGVTVRAITPLVTGYRLAVGSAADSGWFDADGVVLATPAAKTARLLREVDAAAAADLDTIETASMAIVTLAYRDVELPAGSGLLVGSGQGFAVKAITISSQKWPGSPAGLTLLRASIGRAGDATHLQRDDAELAELAAREVGALLGLDARPIDQLVTRWGGALPQYGVGHLATVARIEASVGRRPGLAVCGASYRGVGIPACIASGTSAAHQVLATVAPRGQ